MKLPGSLLAAFTTLALAAPAMADTAASAPTTPSASAPAKLTGAARNARSAKIKRAGRKHRKAVAATPVAAPKAAPAATPGPVRVMPDPCLGCGMG